MFLNQGLKSELLIYYFHFCLNLNLYITYELLLYITNGKKNELIAQQSIFEIGKIRFQIDFSIF